jgi:amino acid adenylation domain-containing protein
MWRLRQDSAEYNVPKVTRLRGAFDETALRWAVDRVVARHRVLNATFPTSADQPGMRFGDAPVPWEFVDLTDGQDGLAGAVAQAVVAPFDLVRGPVFRARLIRSSAEDHTLVLVFHHIVVDGWSLGIIDRELAALYEARRRGEPDPLPELAFQYDDYVDAERRLLAGPRGTAALDYWRRQLADVPAGLPLPTDRPHSAPFVTGDARPFDLTDELRSGVEALSRAYRATRFVTLLAGYAALLFRVTGVSDLVIGVPVSGRTSSQVEPIVGLFVNMVPVRLRVTSSTTFAELLLQVRDTFLAGYEYQDLPFQQLVEQLRPERAPFRHPLFQAVFAYEETGGVAGLGAASQVGTDVPIDTAKFELTLQVTWGGDRDGWFGYQTDLFDDDTVERLAHRYPVLLADAVASPGTPLSQLRMLADAERTELLSWAGPGRAATGRVEHMVEWQAAVRPDAVAIRDGERIVTYRELNDLAHRVAGGLRTLGARPGALVATCLPRGADLVITQLGVLKSGAAYLPLDPTNPPARLASVVAEAAPVLVVSARPDDTFHTATTVAELLSTTWQAPDHADDPADLAYVIYTSGSTGRPKGVMVEHHSLADLVAWHLREFGFAAGDRTTLVAAPGFDATVWEIWPALAAGCAIDIPDQQTVLSPFALRDWLVAHDITYTFLPTPMAQRLSAEPWPDGASLTVLVGGDRLHELTGPLPFRLVNNYGPTENTVCATSGPARTDGITPDIGRPITGVTAFVLDTELTMAPIGVPGELFLGGSQLARGYLGRPGQTADRFVPDPFATIPGQRLYRTGDLVRWRSDGTLDFLGRTDRQLKIRGFRIEPGEIESVLRTDPSVENVVVAMAPGNADESVLTAYLVPSDGDSPPDPARLRDLAATTLPHYMVPVRYLVSATLPLTSNGKVDVAALAEHAEQLAPIAPGRRAVTPMEHSVAQVWADVLGAPSADTLDVDGNFFDTGGHSMLLATLAERLSARLSRAIPILDLYQYPSVAALARQLDDPTVDSTAESATDSRPRPGRDNAARLRAVRARNQRTRGSQGAQA